MGNKCVVWGSGLDQASHATTTPQVRVLRALKLWLKESVVCALRVCVNISFRIIILLPSDFVHSHQIA